MSDNNTQTNQVESAAPAAAANNIPAATLRTRKLVVMAMLVAVAYALTALTQFTLPAVGGFLHYDPKSVVIAIGAFIYGPVSGVAMSVVVAILEMLTIGTTGWVGFVMNILVTGCFSCFSALVYSKRKTMGGAIVGLAIGVVLTTAVMMLWNYLIDPFYYNMPREAVAQMLIPLFLPFNLIQGSINMGLTLLLYNPIVTALRAARMLPPRQTPRQKRGVTVGVVLASVFLMITGVVFLLVMLGVL